MKNLKRLLLTLGNTVLLYLVFAAPVAAQVATPSATPTPVRTTSTLLEAGSLPLTVTAAAVGIGLLLAGVIVLRQAKQAA